MTGFTPLVRAHFLASSRNKAELFFTFAFPLIFIVVFGLLFGSDPADHGKTVIDYLAPGVMAWGVGNAAVFGVAYSLVKWRGTDLLRTIRRTPTSVLTVLGSRLVIVCVVAVAQAVLFLAVAMLPPFRLHASALGLLLTLPVLVAGTLAFFSIGVVVGNVCRTPDAVGAFANCLMVPMAFLSGSFIPLSKSPGWLRAFSHVLPLRYMNEAVTGVLDGSRISLGPYALRLLALLVFAAALSALAARTFRWENKS
ncbi:ABC transporter permease [Streptomyces sp. NPDC007205]|uniref:ABC transporter permease n=1 Tax=Streptomyces sp. NPDC007205 TaxID=3154316 RepID=UPI0033E02B49